MEDGNLNIRERQIYLKGEAEEGSHIGYFKSEVSSTSGFEEI
jgi:hypothetical protein